MKKLIVIAIVAMMAMAMATAASAAVGVELNMMPIWDGGNTTMITMGWYEGSTNAKDLGVAGWQPDATQPLPAMSDQAELAIASVSTTLTGRIMADYRLAPAAGAPAVWNISASVPAGFDMTNSTDFQLGLNAWFSDGKTLPAGYKMTLLKGTWSAANYTTATAGDILTVFAQNMAGSDTNPNLSTGPMFNIDGATFTLVAEVASAPVVPEPGSMLAMFSGLVGLVGFGIRRRK